MYNSKKIFLGLSIINGMENLVSYMLSVTKLLGGIDDII